MRKATFSTKNISKNTEFVLKNVSNINFYNAGTSNVSVNGKKILSGKEFRISDNHILDEIQFKIEFDSNNPTDNKLEVAFLSIIEVKENNIC